MALGKDKDRLSRLPVFACLDADALHLDRLLGRDPQTCRG